MIRLASVTPLYVAVIALNSLLGSEGQFPNRPPFSAIDGGVVSSSGQGILSRIPFVSNLKALPNFFRRFGVGASGVGTKLSFRSVTGENALYYHGAQVWNVKLNVTGLEELRDLVDLLGVEVWNINQDGIDILIKKKNTQKARDFILKTNFTYNVMISDVEAAIEDTYRKVNNTRRMTSRPWLRTNETSMDWNRYHDVDDITDFLQYCLERYSDITQIITIGRTYNKRNIEVLRISNGNPENHAIFITAGLQGRDWISPAAVTYAIAKLLWIWDNSSHNYSDIDWYFLPASNPDGLEYTWLTDRLWAKNRRPTTTNCYGTNLDRNFGYQWGGDGSSDETCNSYYRGPEPFSESETKAIKQFLTHISTKLDAFISFGAYGQLITYPWGDANYITKNQNNLHKVAKRARMNVRNLNAAEYQVGSSYRMKLAQSGNIADWVQHDTSPKYVYSVYLKDQGLYGYLLPPDYIIESGDEAYEIIKTVVSGLIKLD